MSYWDNIVPIFYNEGIRSNLISNIYTFLFGLFIFIIIQIYFRITNRNNMIRFFLLDKKNPRITIYLSRHISATKIPMSNSPAHKKLQGLQQQERLSSIQEKQNIKDFISVGAAEMIGASQLKEELERTFAPGGIIGTIMNMIEASRNMKTDIQVKINMCPHDEKSFDDHDTIIFIGGPRANWGTYYCMYEEEAAIVRLGRIEKNRIYEVNSGRYEDCSPEQNYVLIQRFTKTNGRTIFYLCGTGVYGTAEAVNYLRRSWKRIYKFITQDRATNFFIKFITDRRIVEQIELYTSKEWLEKSYSMHIRPQYRL